ncbi:MAG: hypothetical protein KIT17_09865 [Rubrivivax sp.]|nr:hypothetical protein [Rubrivivax sp.]
MTASWRRDLGCVTAPRCGGGMIGGTDEEPVTAHAGASLPAAVIETSPAALTMPE